MLPFLVFIVIYLGAGIILNAQGVDMAFYQFPAPTALLLAIRQEHGGRLRTGWYSGREALPEGFVPEAFDYVKLGPWREACGPLSHPHTNQRLYRIDHTTGRMLDITARMQRRMP